MLLLLRIILIGLLVTALLSAYVGFVRPSRPHLRISAVLMLTVVLILGAILWNDHRDRKVRARAAAELPASLYTEAAALYPQIRLTAFSEVPACVGYARRLTEFYGKYALVYPRRHEEGQALLEQWQTPAQGTADPMPDRNCSDAAELHRFVHEGQVELERRAAMAKYQR